MCMADLLDQASNNRQAIAIIKYCLDTGYLSYDEAKTLAQPTIDKINDLTVIKTKELNRKYGLNRKPALLNFTSLMR